jgi:DNA-binding transcriptional MocR family regulator
VAVEAPTYHNILGTLAGLGIKAVPVPASWEGPDLGALERTLRRPDVKAFYTIPTFHNPMGITTSLAHRRALLAVAARCGAAVLEDAFEMDLRYSGRAVPSLLALDERDIVLHHFSFSKSLFPGVRVGSITARGRVVEGLVALKQATDLSDSLPLQAALADFVAGGAYDRHLSRLRRVLRSRRDAMLDVLEECMPSGTSWTRPDGGYQVWVELPFELDSRDLLADAARAGVLFAPGSQFWPDGGPSRTLRLTIAQADEEQIRTGVQVLARVIQEHLDLEPVAHQASTVHL